MLIFNILISHFALIFEEKDKLLGYIIQKKIGEPLFAARIVS